MLISVAAMTIANSSAAGEDSVVFDRHTPIVKVYQKVHKAVVNISGKGVVTTGFSRGYDFPDMFDFFAPRRAEVTVLGSGVVVHEDGYIVTNAHVAKDAQNIKISFSDGSELPASVISIDEDKDLAVLRVESAGKLDFVHLGRSDDLMIGETVIAIGNPYGYSNTLTSGVISAVNRDIQVSQGRWLRGLLQTDAPINPGNSGGPLLNINGELIGITTAIRAEAQNIGFAIPVDMLSSNLGNMLMPEKLRRVWLGLTMGTIKKVGEHSGLVVDSVSKDSPADKKGIKPGDMVLEIDNKPVTNSLDFYIRMINKEVGEPIAVKYVRPGDKSEKIMDVELTLAARPVPDGGKLALNFFQMQVSELTRQVARRFGFEDAYPVLIVTDVDKDGTAGKAGLSAGDLILELNGAVVRNMREFSLEMEKIAPGDTARLRIVRIVQSPFGQVQRQFIIELRAGAEKTAKEKSLDGAV